MTELTKAQAAKAVNIKPGEVFDFVLKPDGRIGVVTVDGRKLYAEPKTVSKEQGEKREQSI